MNVALIVDNRAMLSSSSIRHSLSLVAFLLASAVAHAAPLSADGLREQFPASSIDSVARADAALTATSGAKLRVDKDYKASTRECLRTILVNACLDGARDVRRRRLADIDAIELEANRFKRRERDDRLAADRARREADRAAKASADAELRSRNREAFEAKQREAAQSVADRARSDAIRARGKPHQPLIKGPPPGDAEANARQREKNAADYQKKIVAAASHDQVIKRRIVEKEAERKHRDEAKAVKDAKTAAAAAAAAAAAQSPFPSLSGPKP